MEEVKWKKEILKPEANKGAKMCHKQGRFILFLASCFILLFSCSLPLASAQDAVKILEEIPVQHAGRIKPFQSFSQEVVLYVTGRTQFANQPPARLVWDWIASPEKWYTRPLIPVKHHALREEFGLMLVGDRVSAEIALNHQPFLESIQAAAEKQQRKDKLTELEKNRMQIYEKASLFRSIGEGAMPGWIAHPAEPRASWLPLASLRAADGHEVITQFYPAERVQELSESLSALMEQTRSGGVIPAEGMSQYRQALERLHASRGVILDPSLIQKENLYNRLDPFRWAWIFYLISFAFSLAWFLLRERVPLAAKGVYLTGLTAYLAGFGLHGYGFFLRCLIAGRPPVTNMYESMIWVSWAVAFFALILYAVYRTLFIRNTAALVAAFALILAEAFPVALNPAISPLVPVLRSNLWLSVHVLTITLSYGAFMLAWGLGHGVLYSFAFKPKAVETQRRLSQYLYRTLQIGVVLLAAGTILGGVWANYSWGRFWGWDPKETWALIALLGYLVVLHGRFAGWLGNFGIAAGSVVAFLGVLMAWYGVNFVLAAGLHSYGFGGGGLKYVLTAIFLDSALIGALAWKAKRPKGTKSADHQVSR